jgi:hypothetical protein
MRQCRLQYKYGYHILPQIGRMRWSYLFL